MAPREKIRVGILGVTGSVGQKFVQLLANHPWFEVTAIAASERSAGKSYKEAVRWMMPTAIPSKTANMKVELCEPTLDCDWVFSGLDSSVAGDIETTFAQAGYTVISNSRNHRFDPDVPLMVPEVNLDHLKLLGYQKFVRGRILTNPNCSTIGLSIALKPLEDLFGIESVHVVTMQALSGAGFPGVSSLEILDNVIPYISGEEHKMETEPLKIFGNFDKGVISPAQFKISAQCNRVSVLDGHTECVSIKLKRKATEEELIDGWRSFKAKPQAWKLPTAPEHPIHYFDENHFPQPKLHRDLDKGMAVSIGRLRKCPLFDFKFTLLSHNTIRGAAGGALLLAECLAHLEQ